MSRRGPIGVKGYARLLHLLNDPLTAADLGRVADVNYKVYVPFLAACERFQRARIVDWKLNYGRAPTAVWAAGSGDRAPLPTTRPNGRPVEFAPKTLAQPIQVGMLMFFNILDAFDGGATAAMAAQHSGATVILVQQLAKVLLGFGLIRISDWRFRGNPVGSAGPCGGGLAPVYQMGAGPNRQRPKNKSRAQINADYVRRKKLKETTRTIESMCRPQASIFVLAQHHAQQHAHHQGA